MFASCMTIWTLFQYIVADNMVFMMMTGCQQLHFRVIVGVTTSGVSLESFNIQKFSGESKTYKKRGNSLNVAQ